MLSPFSSSWRAKSMRVKKPFKSAVGAWFWFCENRLSSSPHDSIVQPVDILKAVDRLHEHETIDMEHLLVLKKYGFRGKSPDPFFSEERKAYRVWKEALDRLEVELLKIGIVAK